MPHRTTTCEVTLDGVSAGYPRRLVLHQLGAHIPQSATTAVVGPNGSGKSTLLSVLAGVLPLTAGAMHRAHTARPSLVVQRSTVSDTLPLTVREVVAMGRWAHLGRWRRPTERDRQVVEECMSRLGIGDLAQRQLGELSGGQRQRALVAQGLAQQAPLLLLDEPTTGLDVTAQENIAAALEAATADGVTVVQATHDLNAARQAQHCLLLQDGHLTAEGSPQRVLTDEALRRTWNLPAPAHAQPGR